jgi:hypothetical protein
LSKSPSEIFTSFAGFKHQSRSHCHSVDRPDRKSDAAMRRQNARHAWSDDPKSRLSTVGSFFLLAGVIRDFLKSPQTSFQISTIICAISTGRSLSAEESERSEDSESFLESLESLSLTPPLTPPLTDGLFSVFLQRLGFPPAFPFLLAILAFFSSAHIRLE